MKIPLVGATQVRIGTDTVIIVPAHTYAGWALHPLYEGCTKKGKVKLSSERWCLTHAPTGLRASSFAHFIPFEIHLESFYRAVDENASLAHDIYEEVRGTDYCNLPRLSEELSIRGRQFVEEVNRCTRL